MKRKQILFFWIRLISFLFVLTIAVNAIGNLFDGGMDILQSASSLRHLPNDSVDVLWLGTSHMNYNVIPQYLYDLSGIPSAMATGNSVDLKGSYWELREVLTRQSPQVVVLDVYAAAAPYCYFYVQNVLAMENKDAMFSGSNPYNTATGVARWLPLGSIFKLPAIWEAYQQSGADGYAYQQLTRLHSRYSELTRMDFDHVRGDSRYIRNFGYLYSNQTLENFETRPYTLQDAMAANEVGTFWEFTPEQLEEARLLESTITELKRIVDFTRREGIQLILCAAPYMTNAAEEKLFAQVGKLAAGWGVPYVGLEAAGMDVRANVRDLGHLNDDGARLYTEFWNDYFAENYSFPDRRESADARYAPWCDHMGSYEEQNTAMRLLDYEGSLTGFLEQVSTLSSDYMVLITSEGEVYEGFTEDDYCILTEKMGSEDEALEDWYYTGTGTLDMVFCGGKLLKTHYDENGRRYELKWNLLGHDVVFESGLRSRVDGVSCGRAEEGMTVAVFSRLEHRLMGYKNFDLTEILWDDEE